MVKTAKRTMSKALMWALSLVMVWAMIPEIGGVQPVFAVEYRFMIGEEVYTSPDAVVTAINNMNPKPDEIEVVIPCSDYSQLKDAFTWAYNWQTADIKAIEGTKMVIKLLNDIQMPDTIEYSNKIRVKKDGTGFDTATLDLNGYGIIGNNKECIIRLISRTLILTDSRPNEGTHYYYIDNDGLAHVVADESNQAYIDAGEDNQGSFTGGYLTRGATASGDGSGGHGGSAITLRDEDANFDTSKLIMEGGTIIGNDARYRGGVIAVPYEKATFEMTGGAIIGNKTGDDGAIYVKENGKATVSGTALIERNTCASSNAAGVTVDGATFEMTGGKIRNNRNVRNNSGGIGGININSTSTVTIGGTAEITGNSSAHQNANAGGIFVDPSATFTLAGTPVISGNRISDADSNIVLWKGSTASAKIIIDGSFEPAGTIGVTSKQQSGSTYPVDITTGVTADNHDAVKAAFVSDASGYTIKSSAATANQLALGTYTALTANPTLNNNSPRIGSTINAVSAADDITWQWQRSATQDGTYTDISGATGSSYTPVLADLGYFIRVVATQESTVKYSSPTNSAVQKKSRPDRPSTAEAAGFTVDYGAESFTVGSGYEVVAEDEYSASAITDLSSVLDKTTPKVYLRVAETEDTQCGETLTVDLAARPGAPTELSTANASNGTAADGKITGTVAGMEYSLKGTDIWNDASATETPVAAGTYLVRVKATSTAPHGKTTEVTVGSDYAALDETATPLTIELPVGHSVPQVGDVLTANCLATDLVYEWFVDGVSQGDPSSSNTYTVKPEDYGKAIAVKVKQTVNPQGGAYAAGSEPVLTSSQTSKVQADVEAGGKGYASISAAAAAAGGETVVLLKDITEDVVTTETAEIDLNGHTLTGTVKAEAGTVTLTDSKSGGTVTGVVSGNTGNVVIEGGKYQSAPAATDPGLVTIKGGIFAGDPTAAAGVDVVADKMVYQLEGGVFSIGEKPDTAAASISISTGETAGDVATTIDAGDQADARAVAASAEATTGLSEIVANNVSEIVTNSAAVTDGTKNIVIVPALQVTTEDYQLTAGHASMTLNIEATYKSYETDGAITDAAGVTANITDQTKVKQIGEGLLDTKGTEIGVQFEVPDAFADALGGTGATIANPHRVFIQHVHNGKHFEYPTDLFYNALKYIVRFTNPNGFSTFTLEKTSQSVAKLGDLYYTVFQEAIDDAADGAVIQLQNDQDVNAQLNTAKTITIVKQNPTDTNEINITGAGKIQVAVTDNGGGSYTFVGTKKSSSGSSHSGNSSSAVVTKPEEKPQETEVQPQPEETKGASYKDCAKSKDCPLHGLKDLKAELWYHDGLHWALESAIMKGFEDGTFRPNGSTTRAQVATMLYRIAGSPAVTAGSSYSDVAKGKWYSDAIQWAAANGVVTGYEDGTFRPDDAVTREQLAAMIYRYAKFKGQGFTGSWAFTLSYSDAGSVSSYAFEPMCWMTMKGVIQGMDGKLEARGLATRAQIATMFMRYSEL